MSVRRIFPEDRPRRRRKRALGAGEIIEFLEYLAPPALAVPEEPYGFQVGAPTLAVGTVILAPMPSFDALALAASRKHSLLITALPLLTEPIMSVRRDDPIGGKLAYLLEHRINYYVLANTFFSAPGGFDDSLAERLGLAATSSIVPTSYEPQYKIAVYVPPKSAERVMNAAADAGAGRIGNYTHCSFQTQGTGTFLPRDGAKPTLGKVGNLERVGEVRMEMVVPQRELKGVIAAILEAHPYEEVAYDVYMVKNPGVQYGRGRMGELPLKVSLETVLAQVQDALELKSVRLSHRPEFPIGSLATAAGAANGLFARANTAGAGAFVTGAASVQDLMLADNSTTVVVDVGFSASVRPGLERLCRQLQDTFALDGAEILYSG